MSRIISRRKDANDWHLQNTAATLLSLPLALSLRKERMFMYCLLVPTPYKKMVLPSRLYDWSLYVPVYL